MYQKKRRIAAEVRKEEKDSSEESKWKKAPNEWPNLLNNFPLTRPFPFSTICGTDNKLWDIQWTTSGYKEVGLRRKKN